MQRARGRVADGVDAPFPYLSDRRDKGPVRGRCWLCEEAADLELSHVLPRWAFREWSGSGGGVLTTWDTSAASPVQDGLKRYLLCRPCERYLGQGEALLRRIQYDKPDDLVPHGLSLGRAAAGLPTIAGTRRMTLHRGLVGIAFKILITDPNPHSSSRRARIARLRQALLSEEYDGLSAPVAFELVNVGGERLPIDRVIWGAADQLARFTIGAFHWLVPMGAMESAFDGIGWAMLTHAVDPSDPRKQLWVDIEDLDLADLVGRTLGDNASCGT